MVNPTEMEVSDWSQRWDDRKIGFHLSEANSILVKNFEQVKGSTVFVPLCGKTLDMLWLAQQGCTVIGVEAVGKAIEEFFEENGIGHTV
uniref:Thiopurine S-methyltransferase n=1 Tax=Plectus sambesii TaxID=2011161 RepID=A0A914VBA6_9BILA